MGFRFRKSIKIAPGVKINLGLGGASLTLGGRGASINIGKRGTYANVGLPGTGLSYRTRLGGGPNSRFASGASHQTGSGLIANNDGARLLEEHAIAEALITRIHLETPAPGSMKPELAEHVFCEPEPKPPKAIVIPPEPVIQDVTSGFYGLFNALKGFCGGKSTAELEREAQAEYRQAHTAWEIERVRTTAEYQAQLTHWRKSKEQWFSRKQASKSEEIQKAAQFERDLRVNAAFQEDLLASAFDSLNWPHETQFSWEVRSGSAGNRVVLDIDLPEIDMLNNALLTMGQRGLRQKEKTQKQLREEYAQHIHGILFRVIGVVFAVLPDIQSVTASGYSQRQSKTTGYIENEYLLSVVVDGEQWKRINFSGLDNVDPIESLSIFHIQRQMTATCIFKPIKPIR